MVKLHATTRLLIRYIFFLVVGIFFHCQICAGQSNADGQHIRDSLYRHISREMSAESAYFLTYPQNHTFIIHDLGDNSVELARLDAFLRVALQHPDLYVKHIYLTGYCSIEGAYQVNNRLSRERVEQLYLYLRDRHPGIFDHDHSIASVAEDWQGLSRLVRESSLEEREEILDIIHKVPSYDERERLLRRLNGGRVFRYMEKHFFPSSRRVEVRIEYSLTPKAMPVVSEPLVREATPSAADNLATIGLPGVVARPRPMTDCRTPLLGIKTNLLLLAGVQSDLKHTTFTPNLSLEYYISKNWSVELGAMYSYWHYNHRQAFQGLSGYRIEPRFRVPFGERGPEMFVGSYFRSGDYDLREAEPRTGTLPAGGTGKYFDAGLSAGFFFPVWKNFGLEVGGRAGYIKTNAILYNAEEGRNVYGGRQRYNKFRVTNIGLNLVYRIKN